MNRLNRKSLWLFFLSVSIIFWAVACDSAKQMNNTNQLTSMERMKRPPELKKSTALFLSTKFPGRWLLHGSTTESIKLGKYEQDLIKSHTQRLEEALSKNSSIPEVASIARLFSSKLRVCIADMVKLAPVCSTELAQQPGILISLYPEQARRTRQVRTLIVYEHGSVFIPLLANQDPAWYNARFLHELYHAQQDYNGAVGAKAPYKSWAWTEEEVIAHAIARKVLDRETAGKYMEVVTEIANSKNAADIQGLLAGLSASDFNRIDSLFEEPSSDEAGNRLPQYIFDILNSWISQRYSGGEMLRQKINGYLMVTSE